MFILNAILIPVGISYEERKIQVLMPKVKLLGEQ